MNWTRNLRLAAIACTLCVAAPVAASELAGVAKAIDGDTLSIGTTKVRLDGVDAPQADQPCLDEAGKQWTCGLQARRQLASLLEGKRVACEPRRVNRYQRVVAFCRVDGVDLGKLMAEQGWALATDSRYQGAQAAAQQAQIGVWKGSFVNPADWRTRKQTPHVLGAKRSISPDAARALTLSAFGAMPPAPDCAIKGNINWSGVCIYHPPEGRWYRQIHLKRQQGDRWFCTAAEAKAAGCRETRR